MPGTGSPSQARLSQKPCDQVGGEIGKATGLSNATLTVYSGGTKPPGVSTHCARIPYLWIFRREMTASVKEMLRTHLNIPWETQVFLGVSFIADNGRHCKALEVDVDPTKCSDCHCNIVKLELKGSNCRAVCSFMSPLQCHRLWPRIWNGILSCCIIVLYFLCFLSSDIYICTFCYCSSRSPTNPVKVKVPPEQTFCFVCCTLSTTMSSAVSGTLSRAWMRVLEKVKITEFCLYGPLMQAVINFHNKYSRSLGVYLFVEDIGWVWFLIAKQQTEIWVHLTFSVPKPQYEAENSRECAHWPDLKWMVSSLN